MTLRRVVLGTGIALGLSAMLVAQVPYAPVADAAKQGDVVTVKALLKKAKLSPREILRTKEDLYKELILAKTTLSDDALIDLMVEHPDLIQRPIVEKGDKAWLARPAERVNDLM